MILPVSNFLKSLLPKTLSSTLALLATLTYGHSPPFHHQQNQQFVNILTQALYSLANICLPSLLSLLLQHKQLIYIQTQSTSSIFILCLYFPPQTFKKSNVQPILLVPSVLLSSSVRIHQLSIIGPIFKKLHLIYFFRKFSFQHEKKK